MKKLVGLAFVVGAVSGIAFSGVALGVAPNDSTAMQLSRLVMPKEIYKDMLHQTVEGIVAGAKAQGQTMPASAPPKLEAVVAEALPYEELLQFTAQVYGSRFSDKELGDIIAFYKTPTGIKLAKELPGITKDASVKVGGLLPQRMPALLKKHGLAN